MSYGTPRIGCYVDSARGWKAVFRAIEVAIDFGWPNDRETQNLLARFHHDVLRDDDTQMACDICDDAERWLNDQETRLGLYWGWNDGDFGLYVGDIEDIKDDAGFVSVRSLADARSLGIETDPEDSEYPPADYEGEWLHVNDHGNATLYVRSAGKDTEIWSIV